jgi:transcriptional regulator with XRE-family HTH domain
MCSKTNILKINIMFKEAIEKKITELKIRRSKIADDLGLQRSEISSYLNGNRKLSVEKIEMVLAYLGAKIV